MLQGEMEVSISPLLYRFKLDNSYLSYWRSLYPHDSAIWAIVCFLSIHHSNQTNRLALLTSLRRMVNKLPQFLYLYLWWFARRPIYKTTMRTSFSTSFCKKNNFDENDFIKVIISYCNLSNYKDFTNYFWQLYRYFPIPKYLNPRFINSFLSYILRPSMMRGVCICCLISSQLGRRNSCHSVTKQMASASLAAS